MQDQNWHMPEWWFREERPANDAAYFENMCRVILQAGLNWQVIDKKWQTIKEAFLNFNIAEIVCFTDEDVARLLKNPGIIRNKGKIQAIIYNAKGFEVINKQCGSFQKYLDTLDKSENYRNAVKDLTDKFKWLGPSSASLFLYTVGEKINHWE